MPLIENPVLWVVISFAVFVAAAARPVYRLITTGLDARSARIQSELDQAARLREEAQVTLAAYRKKQAEVLKEAEDILTRTRADAEQMAHTAKADLQLALEKRGKLALERIAQAEAKALQEVQNHMIDIAIGAARAIIKAHVGKGTGSDELVKLATADIERKMH